MGTLRIALLGILENRSDGITASDVFRTCSFPGYLPSCS